MVETRYEVIEKVYPKAPPRGLLSITGDRNLIVSLEAFGVKPTPAYTFEECVTEMRGHVYTHPRTGEIIRFKEPTTAEAILAASYGFRNRVLCDILKQRWFQLGRIVITSEGVFANPPKDAEGRPVTNEQTLKSLLNAGHKVNGIYLLDNDFGFAPYETFKQGDQDSEDFAEGGYARILEHTERTAENLKKMSSKEHHPKGVHICDLIPSETPILRVAGLTYSWRRSWSDWGFLLVGNDSGSDYVGSTFGVLDNTKDTTKGLADKL